MAYLKQKFFAGNWNAWFLNNHVYKIQYNTVIHEAQNASIK